MLKRTACCVAACFVALAARPHTTFAQDVSPQAAAIDAMRTLDSISSSDQRRIGEWVQVQVDVLTATAGQGDLDRWNASKAFRAAFKAQFENTENRQAFLTQFPTQTAVKAARDFGPKTAFGRLVDVRSEEPGYFGTAMRVSVKGTIWSPRPMRVMLRSSTCNR